MFVRIGIVALVVLAAGQAQAQQGGWHFGSWADGPAAAFTRYPNDPCQREELKSAGMLSYLNAKAGQAYGPTVRVVAVQALQGATGQSGGNLTCRGILQLENGQQEAGTLSVQDPGGGSPVNVIGSPTQQRTDVWTRPNGRLCGNSVRRPLRKAACSIRRRSPPAGR